LWRRVAHKISDKIYEKITGDAGYFDTKIVYISESGPYLKRIKKLAMMDYDGANHQYLSDGKNLVLTPRFSPKADKIMYLSYIKQQKPHVYIRDLKTGKEKLVGNFPGMSFAPRFSPNNPNKAVMSIAAKGSTHIFEIDLNNMVTKQLTTGNAINTSPSYSPDGSKIVFNSDRGGSRQLYIMNSDGSNVERISFGGGYYSAPSWSPRGDYIAFTKMSPGEGFKTIYI
jgi:TolB protein